ncbi:MAG: cyclohexanecarboxylate-CoA ligase [Acidimicrobiaceae bacterium]|nr:cyclohexanecarboxylate-CoA ligase [Acidimicrobiaceae bacterium]HAQ22574.1 cyclohexanecarboxylate-CoA ligase [Acidimicrobiaceae bacterium]|tara:strand:+ start:245 stop:1825 length:1581 start_codon:yes stop_codon:yes gene_type:complete
MSEPIYDARTIWELLERRVADSPDRPFLIDPGADDSPERSVTFGEAKIWAERVAAGFTALGVVEGTPVTWVLPTRIETIVASLALSRIGAVQNPIIHIYRDREVAFCVQQTAAEMVLTPGEWGGFDYRGMAERVAAGLERPPSVLDAYEKLPDADPADLPPIPPPGPVGGEPIRWIYYTSGTTSDPKGVLHTDASLMAGGVGLARALDMRPSDVGSIAFPYAHIGGPDYLVCLLANGFPAVLIEKFDLENAIKAFRRLGVTMAGGSTVFYTMFLGVQRQQPDEPLIPTLRLLSGGGAPKPPEVFFEVKSEMGIPVVHGYGMTESPMICQGSPADTDDQLAYTEGHPVHGAQITICRPDGSECDRGEEGEVRIAGPQLFKGYKDERLDIEAFDDRGRFRSGDLAVMQTDGHVTLTGRLKDVIIRKGENIAAKEIEDVLYAHPSVGAVAVIGLPDIERGERVCAVVETADGTEPLAFEEMVRACEAAGLMRQKVPEQLVLHDGPLPRNATLKILKYELKEALAEAPWP